ncbi:MAG: hypothetical protein M3R48_00020 [Candidatus Dormibacteraeota bacterium]|nr:hypothetical protein [Candidatus Dormibacteraeota bacterium]
MADDIADVVAKNGTNNGGQDNAVRELVVQLGVRDANIYFDAFVPTVTAATTARVG